MPIVATEQNPSKLGKIVKELDMSGVPTVAKSRFSMCVPGVETFLDQHKPKSVVLFGIEVRPAAGGVAWAPPPHLSQDGERAPAFACGWPTQAHVCVLQTALELRWRGYEVHVVADGTSSRFNTDRMTAFDRMRQVGVYVSTSESILFQLLGDAEHPAFKTISNLAKASVPDCGLLRVRTESDADAKL